MTETEKVKAEIKVLESKLALLEAIEKHKPPEEAAYFRVYQSWPVADKRWSWGRDKWAAFEAGYTSAVEDWKAVDAEFRPTPQQPEEVAEGLQQAFKRAVEQGVVPRAEEAHKGRQATDQMARLTKISEEEPSRHLTFTPGGTLQVIIRDWWDHVYGTETNSQHIDDLVHRIGAWLPRPQSATSAHNGYVECAIDGFNDCLEQIKRKL